MQIQYFSDTGANRIPHFNVQYWLELGLDALAWNLLHLQLPTRFGRAVHELGSGLGLEGFCRSVLLQLRHTNVYTRNDDLFMHFGSS